MKTRLVTTSLFAIALGLGNAWAKPTVVMKTNKGDITIELNQEKAPKTVENFLAYVKSGQYEGTVFHRVISNFMIQGGGMDANLKEKSTKAPIKNESNNGLSNEAGTIAMARTSDPDSATAQFYINTVDNNSLNYKGPGSGYAVFGKVIKGMDVVKMIEKTPTGSKNGYQDVPKSDIKIEKVIIQ